MIVKNIIKKNLKFKIIYHNIMADNSNKLQVSEQFKQSIVNWVKMDDDLKKIRQTVKEINEEKKNTEQFILSYLKEIGEKDIAITNGKLTKQVSKTHEPLKKATIYTALVEIIKDDNKASQITEHIISSRKIKEKVSLKRMKV
jgi:hypothetical protein